MIDPVLRDDLLRLIEADDRARAKLAATGELFDRYHPQMEAVHRKNAARLTQIIDQVGWPGISQVGESASAAAWRIVQHAIGEPHFVRSCLALLRDAAARGDANLRDVAILDDRVRVLEGRPQLYGTQYDWDDEGKWMLPIGGVESPEDLEERRASMGLPPMEWKRPPPADEPLPAESLLEREAALKDWAKSAGWRR